MGFTKGSMANDLPNIALIFKNWLNIQLSGGLVPVSLKNNTYVNIIKTDITPGYISKYLRRFILVFYN